MLNPQVSGSMIDIANCARYYDTKVKRRIKDFEEY